MVFQSGLVENARRLARRVDDIEVVLFHTASLSNTPSAPEVDALRRLAEENAVSFTVHLPASLNPVSRRMGERRKALLLCREACLRTMDLSPRQYIVHVPVSPPTLVAEPGCYLTRDDALDWKEWGLRAVDFLWAIEDAVGGMDRIAVENINYSPRYLEAIISATGCGLCLDIGHLLLGGEDVAHQLEEYFMHIRVVHLHGVKGHREHLSLACMEGEPVREWLGLLRERGFSGVLTLEVFDPADLEECLTVLENSLSDR